MLILDRSLQAWGSDHFNTVFDDELRTLDAAHLPLQQGLSQSSYASADKLSARVLSAMVEDQYLVVKAGLMYTGIIAGCSCADDPTPLDEVTEYCEALFRIDCQTGETRVSLISE